MMRAMMRRLLFALLLAASWGAAAQEQAFTNRATDLKDRGSLDAATVASLRENTEVKVLQRAGGWARVDAGGKAGWIRVFHLRFPVTAEASGSTGSSIGSFFSGLSGRQKAQSTTLATTGIRGLSTEDLKNANPDAAALKQMQGYRADKPSAERFAKEGKLAESSIEYPGGR